jgi:hypothetical protein
MTAAPLQETDLLKRENYYFTLPGVSGNWYEIKAVIRDFR